MGGGPIFRSGTLLRGYGNLLLLLSYCHCVEHISAIQASSSVFIFGARLHE